MAGSLNVPRDLTKVVELKYTDDTLRRFLVDVANTINILEAKVNSLEARIVALEP